jgi:hypothetical protein
MSEPDEYQMRCQILEIKLNNCTDELANLRIRTKRYEDENKRLKDCLIESLCRLSNIESPF